MSLAQYTPQVMATACRYCGAKVNERCKREVNGMRPVLPHKPRLKDAGVVK